MTEALVNESSSNNKNVDAFLAGLHENYGQSAQVLTRPVDTGRLISDPSDFVVYKSKLYFRANDGVHGTELWKTDGSTSGTKMVLDIRLGSRGSWPISRILGDKFLFLANDGTHGKELWRTDGTTAGTVLLKEFVSGSDGIESVTFFEILNSELYFSTLSLDLSSVQLWKTNGTRAGTLRIKNNVGNSSASTSGRGTVFDSKLYFAGHASRTSRDENGELWRTDGSTIGTTLVKDIFPGFDMYDRYNSSWPSHFAAFDDFMVFIATHGQKYNPNGGLFRLDRGFNMAPILDLLLPDDD